MLKVDGKWVTTRLQSKKTKRVKYKAEQFDRALKIAATLTHLNGRSRRTK